MRPLARNGVRPFDQTFAHDDAAARARAQNDGPHGFISRTRAVRRFGQSQTVRVVFHAHGTVQRLRQILVQRMTDQPCRIGVFNQSRRGGNRPGNADADGAFFAQFGFRAVNQFLNAPDDSLVRADGRDTAAQQNLFGILPQRDDFRFCAAQINAES